ncbi:TPA: hypothetical protein QDZ62_000179 [Stenotrophomonas maltophilia]|nr:hypothetical protein [Stenotrophomonas maltophilia]
MKITSMTNRQQLSWCDRAALVLAIAGLILCGYSVHAMRVEADHRVAQLLAQVEMLRPLLNSNDAAIRGAASGLAATWLQPGLAELNRSMVCSLAAVVASLLAVLTILRICAAARVNRRNFALRQPIAESSRLKKPLSPHNGHSND